MHTRPPCHSVQVVAPGHAGRSGPQSGRHRDVAPATAERPSHFGGWNGLPDAHWSMRPQSCAYVRAQSAFGTAREFMHHFSHLQNASASFVGPGMSSRGGFFFENVTIETPFSMRASRSRV